ncbi:MAG: hypothetical protein Ct9H300mP32_4770 [Verrucomicrobiota bacterium]|nr:MAG: hypothetical protein Ct9H300mP32_4770 [Verrucomicrobiota bacterium]
MRPIIIPFGLPATELMDRKEQRLRQLIGGANPVLGVDLAHVDMLSRPSWSMYLAVAQPSMIRQRGGGDDLISGFISAVYLVEIVEFSRAYPARNF